MIYLGQKSMTLKDLTVSDTQANYAKLAQLDEHQTRMAEVPSSIITGVSFVVDFSVFT